MKQPLFTTGPESLLNSPSHDVIFWDADNPFETRTLLFLCNSPFSVGFICFSKQKGSSSLHQRLPKTVSVAQNSGQAWNTNKIKQRRSQHIHRKPNRIYFELSFACSLPIEATDFTTVMWGVRSLPKYLCWWMLLSPSWPGAMVHLFWELNLGSFQNLDLDLGQAQPASQMPKSLQWI